MLKACVTAPINKGAISEPMKLILERMVKAMLTGVFDLAPTKLYIVGTMQEIPNPTSMKPNELTATFSVICSNTPPNKEVMKNPAKIKKPASCNTFCFQ